MDNQRCILNGHFISSIIDNQIQFEIVAISDPNTHYRAIAQKHTQCKYILNDSAELHNLLKYELVWTYFLSKRYN